jgi:hypothetical protein
MIMGKSPFWVCLHFSGIPLRFARAHFIPRPFKKARSRIMKNNRFRHRLAPMMICITIAGMAQEFPDGPYFGQKRPGLTPEVFTPGMAAFTPDQKQCFFEKDRAIHYMKAEGGRWTGPFIADFLGDNGKGQHPAVTRDGKMLYYNIDGDLWISKREGKTWGKAVKLPEQINSGKYECTISFTRDRSAFYASGRPGTKGQCDIFFSEFRKGRYDEPVNMDGFNTPGSECMIVVSPKEDFVIFSGFNRSDGSGSADMYVSFRAKDDTWSSAQHLGPDFNTPDGEGPLSFSPDGNYLFFSRSNTAGRLVYWVDAKALDRYRPGRGRN